MQFEQPQILPDELPPQTQQMPGASSDAVYADFIRERKVENLLQQINPDNLLADIEARIRGYKDHYKIKLRSAGYRLVYEVEKKEITVWVICVGKRDTIYKILKKRLSK